MLLGLAICFAVQLNAKAKSTEGMGFITCGKKKLIIIDAAATWNAKKKSMQIYLFPFKLTANDLKDIKSGKAWSVGFGKKSPDKKLWESWCPNAQVAIDFSKSDKSLKSATFCNFMFFGLEKKNYTANLNLNAEEVQKSIQDVIAKNNNLTFKSKGAGELFDGKYTWDLSVSCSIFNIKDK
jgi:hypothetical protein